MTAGSRSFCRVLVASDKLAPLNILPVASHTGLSLVTGSPALHTVSLTCHTAVILIDKTQLQQQNQCLHHHPPPPQLLHFHISRCSGFGLDYGRENQAKEPRRSTLNCRSHSGAVSRKMLRDYSCGLLRGIDASRRVSVSPLPSSSARICLGKGRASFDTMTRLFTSILGWLLFFRKPRHKLGPSSSLQCHQ